jgi:hypothetical protein
MTDTSELVRLSVNLGPRAAAALLTISAIEQSNRTDAVNRAIQIYARLVLAIEEGHEVMVRHKRTGDTAVLTWV